MSRLVIIRKYPQGPRCWIAGQRVHHGSVGLIAAVVLIKRPTLAMLALAAVAHDAHDWRVWFRREGPPSVTQYHTTSP